MHHYRRNIGDYHKKAGRLSILQHGVYNLLDACATASTVKMRGLSIVVIESPSGSRLAMGSWLEILADA